MDWYSSVNLEGCPRIRTGMRTQDHHLSLAGELSTHNPTQSYLTSTLSLLRTGYWDQIGPSLIPHNPGHSATLYSIDELWDRACDAPLAADIMEKSRFLRFMLEDTRGRTFSDVFEEYKTFVIRRLMKPEKPAICRARTTGTGEKETETETVNEIADRIAREQNGNGSNSPANSPGPRLEHAEASSSDNSTAATATTTTTAAAITTPDCTMILTAAEPTTLPTTTTATLSPNSNYPPGVRDPSWCICTSCLATITKYVSIFTLTRPALQYCQ